MAFPQRHPFLFSKFFDGGFCPAEEVPTFDDITGVKDDVLGFLKLFKSLLFNILLKPPLAPHPLSSSLFASVFRLIVILLPLPAYITEYNWND